MNTRITLIIISCFITVNTFYSCKKSGGNSSPSIHLITYSINANTIKVFSNINYIDSIGVQRSASAADSTSQWSKTIATSVSPFNAQLEAQGLNGTDSTLNFTLSIYVDGIKQATKSDAADKFTSFDSQVTTVVQ